MKPLIRYANTDKAFTVIASWPNDVFRNLLQEYIDELRQHALWNKPL